MCFSSIFFVSLQLISRWSQAFGPIEFPQWILLIVYFGVVLHVPFSFVFPGNSQLDPDMGSGLILLARLSAVFVQTIRGTSCLMSLFATLAAFEICVVVFFQSYRGTAEAVVTKASWNSCFPVSLLSGNVGFLIPEVWGGTCANRWVLVPPVEVSEAPELVKGA